MCTDHWSWATWFAVGVDAFFLVLYTGIEHHIAPWLPWWRRYGSCLFFGLKLALWMATGRWSSLWRVLCGFVAVGVWLWNWTTYKNNRRNGRKPDETVGARLTDVQQAAFAREARA